MIKIIPIILFFCFSCDDPVVEGCTSPTACNFDPEATKSTECIQPQFCDDWCDDPNDDSDAPPEPRDPNYWNEQGRDCEGTCRGLAAIDDCGICISPSGQNQDILPEDTDSWNGTCQDCEGVAGGDAVEDCAGVCGGEAAIDECNNCTGGTLPDEFYYNFDKDCNDICGGSAIVDDCDICASGDTGLIPDFLKDECGICSGDGYANGPTNNGNDACIGNDNCENMDCTGVCNPSINTSYQTFSEENYCTQNCGADCGWKPLAGCSELSNDNPDEPPCEQLGECILYGSELDNCLECSEGSSNNTACVQACDGVWGGTAVYDCNDDCGGDAIVDECGLCQGAGAIYQCGCSGLVEGTCDCDGNVLDECDVCGGPGPPEGQTCDGVCVAEGDNLDENGYDCANECGGNAQLDDCDICNGDGYIAICFGNENCNNMDCAGNCDGQANFGATLDCAGTCLGFALYGCDSVCCGGTTGNVCATIDQCGTCDNDSSNDCPQDCNNEWGGTASIDNCGTCSGGSTGITPNEGTTPDGLYSCSDINLLVDAGVCTDSDDCATTTCPTLVWEGTNLNGFDFGACGVSSVPTYVTGFDITTLNLSDNSFNNFPENIIDMATLTTVDLRFNLIGSIPASICTLTANSCVVDIRENLIFDCSQVPDCSNSGSIICE